LFSNPELLKKIQMDIGYLAGGESPQTLLGTRPGASAIAVWALLNHLGTNGYRKIVKNCMKLTHRFAQGLEKIPGLTLVTKPTLNIVGIKSEIVSVADLAAALRQKGWAVARFPNHIRVVIMPHIHSNHITLMLSDLKGIMRRFIPKKGDDYDSPF
jgi:tyrosine decarboxylase/aspartate 1-decarboxylase